MSSTTRTGGPRTHHCQSLQAAQVTGTLDARVTGQRTQEISASGGRRPQQVGEKKNCAVISAENKPRRRLEAAVSCSARDALAELPDARADLRLGKKWASGRHEPSKGGRRFPDKVFLKARPPCTSLSTRETRTATFLSIICLIASPAVGRSKAVYKADHPQVSGEVLAGEDEVIDAKLTDKIAREVAEIHALRRPAFVVIAAATWRGIHLRQSRHGPQHGRYMGMLATIINGMALQGSARKVGVNTRVQTAIG